MFPAWPGGVDVSGLSPDTSVMTAERKAVTNVNAPAPLAVRPTMFLKLDQNRDEPYATPERARILSDRALQVAKREIVTWPGFSPTPLHSLAGIAKAAGVASVMYKDEGSRFGLGSFKALGGAYAVMRLIQSVILSRTGELPSAAEISTGSHGEVTRNLTVTCATDGNHGRSVAWGAQTFGCRCVIYVHEHVSQGRCDAIAQYGAEVRRVSGNYDDAVRQAARDAGDSGWHVVSDTSYPGYVDVPRDVMQGYGVMVDEALAQLPVGVSPTHVFVQGGVGGLAAAICATLWERLAEARPMFVVVEPDRAACLFQSAAAGKPVAVEGNLDTIMAGLACGEVSLLAWEILSAGADAFMAIEDEAAAEAMRLLARPPAPDRPVVGGESAVAGLAGFMQVAGYEDLRAELAIDGDSVVLLFGSEGATDPELYERIVGLAPQAVISETELDG